MEAINRKEAKLEQGAVTLTCAPSTAEMENCCEVVAEGKKEGRGVQKEEKSKKKRKQKL